MNTYCIYCAGPLFNASERAEMKMLAETLELAGFEAFLPHRDGFLFGAIVPDIVRTGYSIDVAQGMARQTIFAFDTYQVLVRCHGVLVNLNGRVPDEGAVVEGAMAWTMGKAVVLFKDDARSKIDGFDNPLVAGRGEFRLARRSEDIPQAMHCALAGHPPQPVLVETLPQSIRQIAARGQRLSDSAGAADSRQLFQIISGIFDEFGSTGYTPTHGSL